VALVERANTHRGDRFAEPEASREEVEAGWKHALALHERQVGLGRSREAAERAWHETGSEEAWARICEIQRLSACADGAVAHDEPGDAAH
jgi:DNA primase